MGEEVRYHNRISKQKMYEKAIMKTFEYRLGRQIENEARQFDVIPETFPELMLKRCIMGFKNNIPSTHPFDKLGFSYVHQLLGMATIIKDDEFTNDLFDFLNTHKSLFDFNSQEHMDVCYDLYYENITSYREFCCNMGTFILKNFNSNLECFDKVVSIANSICMCTDEIGFEELINLKRKMVKCIR